MNFIQNFSWGLCLEVTTKTNVQVRVFITEPNIQSSETNRKYLSSARLIARLINYMFGNENGGKYQNDRDKYT